MSWGIIKRDDEMKLWQKRYKNREEIPFLENFNSSMREDRFLFREEIAASSAYAEALLKASVLTEKELARIQAGLEKIEEEIQQDSMLDSYEDIHTAVECLLIQKIGQTGKKLHTGRSRNEQVATIERLFLMKKIPEIIELCESAQQAVIELAEEYFDVLMPGYTHLQQAQPILFSHYILSFFWQVERNKGRLRDGLKRVDSLPLGSGALSGCSIPLDREFLRQKLGFSSISNNSLDAVSDRSFILETLFVLSLLALDLSRLMEDLIIYASQEFGFLELEDSISTSSSLMPQKKNPDFFELIRAGAGRAFGHLTDLFITVKGLPSSYNKDLQMDKIPLYRGVEESIKSLKIVAFILKRIKPNRKNIEKKMSPFLFATDLVDYLTEKGLPFRESHGIVAELVQSAQEKGKRLDRMELEELRTFSSLFDEDIQCVFDFKKSLQTKQTTGSTHPALVEDQIKKAKACLKYKREEKD